MLTRDDRWLAWMSSGVMLAALPACARLARVIPLRVPLDRNEGWNAYQAAAAYSGRLYPHQPQFFFNNYPPLSFYIVGWLDRGVGDAILTGRVVACASFAALAAMLALAARRMRCSLPEALFAAVLFVASTLALSHYVGIDDPQFLGQAVSTAGLLLVLRDRPRAATIISAGGLMAVAVFIKHNVVALPIAAVVWLWSADRRAGATLAIGGICCGTAGALLCASLFGAAFVDGLATPRAYSLAVTADATVRWLVRMPMFLAALAILVARRRSDPDVRFCTCYVAAASAIGLAFLGGDGVDWNVMFESNWACCLAAAVALNRLAIKRQLAAAFLLLPLVAAAAALWRAHVDPRASLAWRIDTAAQTAQDIAFLGRQHGRVLCEELALCYWADKPAEVDAFNFQQHVKHGTRSVAELAGRARTDFEVVQVNEPVTLLDRAVLQALSESHAVVRRGVNGAFWSLPQAPAP